MNLEKVGHSSVSLIINAIVNLPNKILDLVPGERGDAPYCKQSSAPAKILTFEALHHGINFMI